MKKMLLGLLVACSDASRPQLDGAAGPVIDAREIDAASLPPQSARLRVIDRCAEPITVASSHFADVALAPGGFHDYDIPETGLESARYWARIPDGLPPIDSKFEVSFAPLGSGAATFYNLSLVDGYTFPVGVTPVGEGAGAGSCVASDCATLTLDACPDDLRIDDGCMSPCKEWSYPPPFGQGLPESEEPGRHYCCPAPVTPEECRDASDPRSVVNTEYVALVHARCPTAYAYSYDDAAGLHACPAATGFEVVFCP